MLADCNDHTTAALSDLSDTTLQPVNEPITSNTNKARFERALRIEWLGQTVASLCWIASVLTYGISSAGDWLQLFAATAWLLANIANIVTTEAD